MTERPEPQAGLDRVIGLLSTGVGVLFGLLGALLLGGLFGILAEAWIGPSAVLPCAGTGAVIGFCLGFWLREIVGQIFDVF